MTKKIFISVSILFILSSCLALFDSSNFGDVKKLKRIMLKETWNISSMRIYDGERNSTSESFNVVRDTIVATSGAMYFEKKSEKGVRKMTYTNSKGQVTEGFFIIEADVNDDNPTIKFVDLENLFPEPYYDVMYDVISFDKSEIELFMYFYGNGDLTVQECTIILNK